MSDRPTWTYDGTKSFLAYTQAAEQVLRDTIRQTGLVVRIQPRELPYSDPWIVPTLGRVEIYAEPGARFAGREDAPGKKDVPRFMLTRPSPSDPPIGVLELFDIDTAAGGDAISLQAGLGLRAVRCHVHGGGTSGITSSHSEGDESYVVMDGCVVGGRNSHGTYIGEVTASLTLGGRYSNGLGGYDAHRSLARLMLMDGVEITSTDLDGDPAHPDDPRRFASYLHGGISIQHSVIRGCTFTRYAAKQGNRYMVAARCRQSVDGSNYRWIGNAPTNYPVHDSPGWEWFGPRMLNERGLRAEPLARDPRFWSSDYWDVVRAAGFSTPEQLAANPHMFQHRVHSNRFINHGPRGVGLRNEGTAPVNATENSTKPKNKRQDDYDWPLPPRWAERAVMFEGANEFSSYDDAGVQQFIARRGRLASAFDPEDVNAAERDLTGLENEGDGTLARVVHVPTDSRGGLPAWFKKNQALAGLARVFPEYTRYAGPVLDDPGDPVEHRKATAQRRVVDRRP